MGWFHLGGSPAHQTVGIDIIKVVQLRDDKIACARIYWDDATCFRGWVC